MRPYTPYIPKNISEIMELLGWICLNRPKFEDNSGFFPGRGIGTTFFALNEALKVCRKKIGEENYETLVALSHKMRMHFEADPDDNSEDDRKALQCIYDMEDILTSSIR